MPDCLPGGGLKWDLCFTGLQRFGVIRRANFLLVSSDNQQSSGGFGKWSTARQQLEIEAAAWQQERFALYKSSDKRPGHLVLARKETVSVPQTWKPPRVDCGRRPFHGVHVHRATCLRGPKKTECV